MVAKTSKDPLRSHSVKSLATRDVRLVDSSKKIPITKQDPCNKWVIITRLNFVKETLFVLESTK